MNKRLVNEVKDKETIGGRYETLVSVERDSPRDSWFKIIEESELGRRVTEINSKTYEIVSTYYWSTIFTHSSS